MFEVFGLGVVQKESIRGEEGWREGRKEGEKEGGRGPNKKEQMQRKREGTTKGRARTAGIGALLHSPRDKATNTCTLANTHTHSDGKKNT